MVKQISLDEIALQENISEPKRIFLDRCKGRINEAIYIFAETSPRFKRSLSQGENQFKIFVESSENYDAEIRPGSWCYIDSVAIRDDSKGGVIAIRANREEFSFSYKGQSFKIIYGKVPKVSKK